LKILITGGAGFIGSNIADRFVRDGHKVTVVDNLSTGFEENVNPKARFFRADIRSAVIDKIFERTKPDVLCHHAAQIDVRKSTHDPVFDAEVNILGTLNLLNSCAKHMVKKVVFASTGGAIYGEQDYFPADEKHPVNPLSPYGVTKLAIEKYLHFYRKSHGIQYVSLRYANVYGPRQNPFGEAGVVAIFAQRLLSGEQAVINGDGKQTRDFVFVGDVVQSNVLALQYPKSDIFNIGTGIETNVNSVFRLLRSQTQSGQKEIHAPTKPGEQQRSVLDSSKAGRILKWKPRVTLDQGLAQTRDYFKRAGELAHSE
jgi:UDP-glucose 4-epimerase